MKADKNSVEQLIRTARGQLDGLLRMIEENRYCIDISNQLLASIAVLNKANKEVLSAHIKCCVKDALNSGDSEAKLHEIIDIIGKI